MSSSTSAPFPLGQYETGQRDVGSGSAVDVLDSMLGGNYDFETIDRRAVANSGQQRLSAGMVTAKLVRNNSGGNLIPGYAGKLSTASDGVAGVTEISGYATNINEPAFIIDPFVKESVIPDKALFYIILCGLVQFIAGAAISRGGLIVPTTGGKLITATPDTTGGIIEGRWAALGRCTTATAADGDRGWAAIFNKWNF